MLVTVTFELEVDTDNLALAQAEGWRTRMQRIREWPNGRQYHPVDVEVEEDYEPARVLREHEA